jgi:nitroreductase
MDVAEAIGRRRSIRKYSGEPLDRETLITLLEAARLAPSGNNTQPWRFLVVDDPAMRGNLARVCHDQQWMATAPVHIVVCADLGARVDVMERFDEDTPGMDAKRVIRDTAIAIDHLMLQAVELGLGTCWIGWYVQEEIRPLLGIPEHVFVLGVIVVGRPAESPKQRPRRPLAELVFSGQWGTQYLAPTDRR